MAIASQARPEKAGKVKRLDGQHLTLGAKSGHGEGIVQTPNLAAGQQGRRKP